MKLEPERLINLCDQYAACASQKEAAARCGITEGTLYKWLLNSKKGAANFDIEYLGEPMKFHEAFRHAGMMAVYGIEAALTKRSLLGHDEPVYFKGEPSWMLAHDLPLEDVRYVPASCPDDQLQIEYGVYDRYVRHPLTGAKVQRVIHHEPPVAAQLAVLAAKLPETWAPSQNINVNSRSVGVLTIRNSAKPAPQPLPAPVPLAIAAPIAAPVAEPESAEIAEPDGSETPALAAPVQKETPPMATRVDLTKLMPAQLAAREHFQALAAKKPEHPNPQSPGAVKIFKAEDEPKIAEPVRPAPPPSGGCAETDDTRRERIGAGPDPSVVNGARGMKVR